MLQNRFLSPTPHATQISRLLYPAVCSIAAASHAVTWRDSFEDGRLNGWQQPENEKLGEIVGYEVLWTTGKQSLERPGSGPSSADSGSITTIQIRAFFSESQLSDWEEEHLVVEGVGIAREGFMSFGIAIGQHYPPSDGRTGIVYFSIPGDISIKSVSAERQFFAA